MLFVDDLIMLVDETRNWVNTKLELGRTILRSQGFRVGGSKNEYMECKFSNTWNKDVVERWWMASQYLYDIILSNLDQLFKQMER